MSFMIWSRIIRIYFWPRVKDLGLKKAIQPILFLHSFRFVGLAFLVPGVVGANLSPAWANPAAFGDLAVAVLAFAAILLTNRPSFRVALWAFNILGMLDLVNAFIKGPIYNIVPSLHAAYFILVVYVPILFATHLTVFRMLLKNQKLNNPIQISEGYIKS